MKRRFLISVFCLLLAMLFAVPALAEGESLIRNGDFSDNDGSTASGWLCTAWLDDGTSSAFSVRENEEFGFTAVIDSLVANDARFEQKVKVEPDTVYEIRGMVLASEVDGEIGATLSVADTFVYSDMLLDTCGEFYPLELYVRTLADQKELTLYARLGGYNYLASGHVEFADIEMVPVEDTGDIYVQTLTSASGGSSEPEKEKEPMSLKVLFPLLLIMSLAVAGLWYFLRKLWTLEPLEKGGNGKAPLPAVLTVMIAALAVRLILAAAVYGYPNDIACWKGWAESVYQNGFSGFYLTGQFADYPPVYLYVLWVIGALRSLFSLGGDSTALLILVKIPSILADLAGGLILYRLASRRFKGTAALGLAALYLLCPAILTNAAAWGQVDALLALAMMLCLVFIYKDKWIGASVTLVAGILFKPQMLFIAPLFLPGVIRYCRTHKPLRSVLTAVECIAAAAATALLIILPFTGGRPITWIWDLLTGTVGTYPYASVNAANLQSLCGGLWVDQGERFIGLPYQVWGWIGIVSSVGVTLYACVKDRCRENLFFYGAYLLTAIFTTAHGMHERYMFPALLLLAVSYACTGRKSHLFFFLYFSVTQFLNMAVVLANSYLPLNSVITFILSLLEVLGFAAMTVSMFAELKGRNLTAEIRERIPERKRAPEKRTVGFLGSPDPVPAAKHWDRWAIWALTAVYAVVSLVYLGSTKVPETLWLIDDIEAGFTVDLGEDAPAVESFWQYRTLSAEGAKLHVEASDDLDSWVTVYDREFDYSDANDCFKWFTDGLSTDCRYLRFTFPRPYLRELEFALKDVDGNLIPVRKIFDVTGSDPDGPALLFDEQDRVPDAPSHMNGTYFDEIYHARTAWEHLKGLKPYETTHPPLGKLIIMTGVAMFGMTPFGWRFAGTVFGILMVPLFYLLARELLKDGRLAFTAAFLLCWDFMHFAQTRIATIDVFAVFFILCMFYFMLRYLKLSHPEADRKKRGLMLALCGLSFGLGAATKWTCIYAGAGLAVLFFIDVAIGLAAFSRAKKESEPPAWTKTYLRDLVIRLLWCVLFFVAIPAVIYCLSYIPYMTDGFSLNVVLDNQRYMYSYHTGLVDDHFFKSPWYEWPFIIKPIWFYKSDSLPEGMMSSIASFGNPAVWWAGALAMIFMIFKVIRDKASRWKDWFLVLAFLAQFLPWVLVPRSTFIYHYFASVPFIILAIGRVLELLLERKPKAWKLIPVYLAVVLALFILFYPVLSGLPISSAYGAFLKWMPTWYFTY